MRIPRANLSSVGLTLVELLVVVVIIAVFVALLDPFSEPRIKKHALLISCMSNQKQLELGFLMWSGDNGGKFPWQLSTTTNGTMELITNEDVVSQLVVLSDYVRIPSICRCPADTTRTIAENFKTLTDSNVSYFVNVDADSRLGVMTGDRHLQADSGAVGRGNFLVTNGMKLEWTHELHYQRFAMARGALGFTDGHAEVVFTTNLTAAFMRSGTNDERLLVP